MLDKLHRFFFFFYERQIIVVWLKNKNDDTKMMIPKALKFNIVNKDLLY